MRRMCYAVVLGILAAAAPMRAQAVDPISGTWTSDSRPMLELTLDGDAVTGTVFLYEGSSAVPTPIRSGRFEAATGRLTLRGETRRSGEAVPFSIDGRLEGQTLRVTLTAGTFTGTQVLQKAADTEKPA